MGCKEFDGEGGDVSIHCIRKRGAAAPFKTADVTLFVRVKKHEGISYEVARAPAIPDDGKGRRAEHPWAYPALPRDTPSSAATTGELF